MRYGSDTPIIGVSHYGSREKATRGPGSLHIVQLAAPIPPAGHTEVYAHIEAVIRNTLGTDVRPTIQPVFRSPYPANADMKHPYLVNYKMSPVSG